VGEANSWAPLLMAQDNYKKRGGVRKAQREMLLITGLTITGLTTTGLTINSLVMNKYDKRPNPLFTVIASGLLLSLNPL